MRYTYFEIQNFKGICQLRIDLDAPDECEIFTLVGLNESGKTTILEAIDFFSKGNENLDPRELAGSIRPDVHDLIPIAQRANFNDVVEIKAGVMLEESDVEFLKSELKRTNNFTDA